MELLTNEQQNSYQNKKYTTFVLTNEQQNSYQNKKYTIFVKKNLKINMLQIKGIVKLENIVIIHENIEVLHLVYVN